MTLNANGRPADLSRMAGGHEIWIEHMGTPGGNLLLGVAYGDGMREDGILEPGQVKPLVIDPDGLKIHPPLHSVNGRLCFFIPGGKPGYYTASVELQPVLITMTKDSGYRIGPRHRYQHAHSTHSYHQMAKIIVPCGHAGEYHPRHLNGTFDIIPETPCMTPASGIGLTLIYEKKPVPDLRVSVVSKSKGKTVSAGKTDENGFVRLPVTVPGLYMVISRYCDRTNPVADEFDARVFVTTLVLEIGPV